MRRESTRIRMPFDRVWSADELDELRDDIPYRAEVADGILLVSPLPDMWHSDVARELGDTLAAGESGAYCSTEIRRVVDGTVRHSLIADVLCAPKRLRGERIHYADPKRVSLVVEVTTPLTENVDRRLKPWLYAELGIPAMWLVDPDLTLTEYRLTPSTGPEVVRTTTGGTFTTDVPFPVSIDLDSLR